MTRSMAQTTERARTDVLVGQVSVSVTELKISSLVPGQLTASTLKSVTESKTVISDLDQTHWLTVSPSRCCGFVEIVRTC